MKKLYPLLITCLLAGHVFAEDEVVVASEDVKKDAAEMIEQEIVAVVDKLQEEDALTPEQVLEKVQIALEENDGSTQAAYRSILSEKRTQERILLILTGVVLALAFEHGVMPYVVSPLIKKFKKVPAGEGVPPAGEGVPPAGE